MVDTTVVNPQASTTQHLADGGVVGVIRRRVGARRTGARVIEAVRQLQPDVVLLIKGRCIGADDIREMQSLGTAVACWYPDNPRWAGADPGAFDRLAQCDLPILFSHRQAADLASESDRVAVLPFGYNPAWFALTDPDAERTGIAFLGTWSPRRERFMAALEGLPLAIAGTGWRSNSALAGVGDPIVEARAGQVLASAAIGVNLLHPQCEDAHNMRTREICAAGALQVTDPGTDGTPLRHGESCLWFNSPDDLRSVVERALADDQRRREIARAGQGAIAGDTYEQRGEELARLLGFGSHA